MEKHENVASTLSKLDLNDIEQTISQPYHQEGPGRPPRSPLDIFKALIVKQLRSIPSDRELYRRLWNDETLSARVQVTYIVKPMLKVKRLIHPSFYINMRLEVYLKNLLSAIDAFLSQLSEERIESYKPTYEKYDREHLEAQEIREVYSLLKELDH